MSDLNKQLSLEEREALDDLLLHEGWSALLKVIDFLAVEQETKVLKLPAEEGADKLLFAKLKAEGARKLYLDVATLKTKYKGNRSTPPKV